jgi:hypothetical protein
MVDEGLALEQGVESNRQSWMKKKTFGGGVDV